jgi:hypothetical protein
LDLSYCKKSIGTSFEFLNFFSYLKDDCMFKMSFSFLLLSYTENGSRLLENCLQSIRKFYPSQEICIVDANPFGHFTDENNTTRYCRCEKNGYELGSIVKGFDYFSDVQNFLIIHDSAILINKFPPPNVEQEYNKLFSAPKEDMAPCLGIIERWLNETNNSELLSKFREENWEITQGLMGYMSRKLFSKMLDLSLGKILVNNKSEAVASEGLFGFLTHVLCPRTNFSIHPEKLSRYIHGPSEWKYMIKIPTGRGAICNSKFVVNSKEFLGEWGEKVFKNCDPKNRLKLFYRFLLDNKIKFTSSLNEPVSIKFVEDDEFRLGDLLHVQEFVSGFAPSHFIYIIAFIPSLAEKLIDGRNTP